MSYFPRVFKGLSWFKHAPNLSSKTCFVKKKRTCTLYLLRTAITQKKTSKKRGLDLTPPSHLCHIKKKKLPETNAARNSPKTIDGLDDCNFLLGVFASFSEANPSFQGVYFNKKANRSKSQTSRDKKTCICIFCERKHDFFGGGK